MPITNGVLLMGAIFRPSGAAEHDAGQFPRCAHHGVVTRRELRDTPRPAPESRVPYTLSTDIDGGKRRGTTVDEGAWHARYPRRVEVQRRRVAVARMRSLPPMNPFVLLASQPVHRRIGRRYVV